MSSELPQGENIIITNKFILVEIKKWFALHSFFDSLNVTHETQYYMPHELFYIYAWHFRMTSRYCWARSICIFDTHVVSNSFSL